uniref:Chitin-binding type-2 domain-containing protein n=1 Tax=Cacopsylla melanoneura TaxID=428564 RepID=A0A8D8W031_9HEMI
MKSAVILSLVLATSCLVNAQRQRPGGSNSRQPPATRAPVAVAEDVEPSAGSTDQCPEPNGYFADAYQCDKYYECKDGKIKEKLCPDGMVFNDYSSQQEKCDLPFNLDCSQRSELQKPQPSLHCPRQNGYFAHEDAAVCDKFYFCVDGKFNMIVCPSGLVYNEKTGICTWPDEAKKSGCSSQDVFNFSCPKVTTEIGQTHPRYANPDDCQFFYVCINGETPRRNGCKMGQVFNEASKNCDWPRNVPECAEWYKGVLTDDELYNLEFPKPKARPANKGPGRGKPQRQQKPVQEEEEE